MATPASLHAIRHIPAVTPNSQPSRRTADLRFAAIPKKEARINQFKEKLLAAPAVGSRDEALQLMANVMDEVEQGIPEPDRMKPLAAHHFRLLDRPGHEGTWVSSTAFKHHVQVGENGAIRICTYQHPSTPKDRLQADISIITNPRQTPYLVTFLQKPGADGRTLWEYADFAASQPQDDAPRFSGTTPLPMPPAFFAVRRVTS